MMVAIFLGTIGIALWIIFHYYGGKKKVVVSETWDCGTPLTERNEYTATGYAMPIDRVFGGIYRPKSEVKTVNTASPYIFNEKKFKGKEKENIFENYFFIPMVKFFRWIANWVKKIQNGSIRAYLCYILITLAVVLIVLG